MDELAVNAMSTDNDLEVFQLHIENEELIKDVENSEAVACGYCIVSKVTSPLLITVLVVTILGASCAIGYFVSYPRSGTQNSYYNGSSCICANLTHYDNQGCVSDPSHVRICTCNEITQIYNGSYCVTQNSFNGSCTEACNCLNTSNLYCASNQCECETINYWNRTTCVSKELGWQTCNNITWGGDCRPNWFYDGLECIQRKSINGTCLDTYAYDCNTLLVCFSGLCLCPTPTTWSGSNCICSTGQTWTRNTYVAIG
ncbi:unnamed protein product [Rotaria socialis]|uniref:Uncharacterized protein n=1 Tax=Rotaria socialis TaxID=392032 RepID=A0A820QE94_9BILA|nr:unnamed protein product [Rotaria socialis]